MTKAGYAELLKRPEWKARRADIINKAYGRCGQCHKFVEHFHVHHLYYEGDNNPWEYPDDALVALCVDCHSVKHDNVITQSNKNFIKIYPALLNALAKKMKAPLDNSAWLIMYILIYKMEVNGKDVVCMSHKGVLKKLRTSGESLRRGIKTLIGIGLLIPFEGSRNIYQINPEMIYRGRLK